LLSTLHDGRRRTPCKTRFRLAGYVFAGRESNPLDRYERFQFMASSSPELCLAGRSAHKRIRPAECGMPACDDWNMIESGDYLITEFVSVK